MFAAGFMRKPTFVFNSVYQNNSLTMMHVFQHELGATTLIPIMLESDILGSFVIAERVFGGRATSPPFMFSPYTHQPCNVVCTLTTNLEQAISVNHVT